MNILAMVNIFLWFCALFMGVIIPGGMGIFLFIMSAVGYLKNAAGDKQCPYFVVPGIGGRVLRWCDCLPENLGNPWETSDAMD